MEVLTKAPAVVPAEDEARREIEAMVGRARIAQAAIENYAQEQADALVTAVGWQVYKLAPRGVGQTCGQEQGFGNVQGKIAKFANRVREPWPTWLRSRPVASSRKTQRVAWSRSPSRSASLPLSFPPRGRTPRHRLRR